jgi:predicted murein hydrolase (TIGR00659 family)
MKGELHQIWVYLSTTPLLGLTLTLCAYVLGFYLYRKFRFNPLVNPVLIAVLVLVSLLMASETPYSRYFEGAQFVHFMLGPATVALAVPLYRQLHHVRSSITAVVVALVFGSLAAVFSAVGIAWLLGASRATLLSLAPKSVTTPVAMGIAEQIGGLPSLTAVLVILSGITGAVLGTYTLNLVRVKDWRARGIAMGIAAHGIGTARAFTVNEVAGAFSSLAMGLNALATAILVPILMVLLN